MLLCALSFVPADVALWIWAFIEKFRFRFILVFVSVLFNDFIRVFIRCGYCLLSAIHRCILYSGIRRCFQPNQCHLYLCHTVIVIWYCLFPQKRIRVAGIVIAVIRVRPAPMGVGRGAGRGLVTPGFWNLKFFYYNFKVVFLVSRRKNEMSPLLFPHGNIFMFTYKKIPHWHPLEHILPTLMPAPWLFQ